jgi:preprotein translocase subunit SecG
MASEEMAGGSTSSGSATSTSTTTAGTVASLTNNTALSITLIVGLFFLALNLLLFGAIYRQRMNHHRKSKKQVKLEQQLKLYSPIGIPVAK